MSKKPEPRPLVGLAAGMVAGAAASFAMALFQARAAKLVPQASEGEPATVKAADKAAQAVSGEEVPEPWREQAGQAVHYVTGITLGAIYGVIAEYRPAATAGFGSAFGLVTSALLDEAAVPAAGLSGSPKEAPAAVHAYGISAHLVYGVVLEAARRLIAGRLG